jgi:hypothetical protein
MHKSAREAGKAESRQEQDAGRKQRELAGGRTLRTAIRTKSR